MTPRTFGASDTPTAHTASSGGPVSPQRAWCRSIDLASARSWWARRSSLLDHLITSRSTWFTAPCRRLAPSLALLRRYRLAPSPRGSAALLSPTPHIAAGRGRSGSVKLISRQGVDHTARYPDIVAALQAIEVPTLILDGEVAIFDQKLISRFEWLRRRAPAEIATPPDGDGLKAGSRCSSAVMRGWWPRIRRRPTSAGAACIGSRSSSPATVRSSASGTGARTADRYTGSEPTRRVDLDGRRPIRDTSEVNSALPVVEVVEATPVGLCGCGCLFSQWSEPCCHRAVTVPQGR